MVRVMVMVMMMMTMMTFMLIFMMINTSLALKHSIRGNFYDDQHLSHSQKLKPNIRFGGILFMNALSYSGPQ